MLTRRSKTDPDWKELVEGWKATQQALRSRMITRPLSPLPRFVAGADAAFSIDKSTVFAAAVLYDRQEKQIIEIRRAQRPADVPYIPGFLSFREGPAVLAAVGGLRHEFGAILFDGQGYAHPRRCGLATHLGITLDIPSVGVAKSRFIGRHDDPGPAAGDSTPLMDSDEQIGLVLRTQDGRRPLYVSIGHRVDLPTAAALALACCTRYRIPEPTRSADIEVAKEKKRSVVSGP